MCPRAGHPRRAGASVGNAIRASRASVWDAGHASEASRAGLGGRSEASRAGRRGADASEASSYSLHRASAASTDPYEHKESDGQRHAHSRSSHLTNNQPAGDNSAHSTFTSTSTFFIKHRQHRREKASVGMSSSPIEASPFTTTSREAGLDGVVANLHGIRRRRSPLRGVLKRTREATEEIAGEAGGDRERAFW